MPHLHILVAARRFEGPRKNAVNFAAILCDILLYSVYYITCFFYYGVLDGNTNRGYIVAWFFFRDINFKMVTI